jgi:hypothetical protein
MMKKNKGSVLILTFLFMTTSVVLTMAYLAMIRYDTVLVNSRSNGVHALYIAEAGLNKAAWYLLNIAPDNTTDGSWRTLAYPTAPGLNSNDPQQESFGGGSYTIWVQDSSGAIEIISSGVYNGDTCIVHQQENMTLTPPDSRTLTAVAGSWGINQI